MSRTSKGVIAAIAVVVAIAALTIAVIANKGSQLVSSIDSGPCALEQTDLGGFVDIPGGGFIKEADPKYPEEGPPDKIFVSPFRLQAHEVTNSQFAAFVAATGYVTEAEQNGGSAQFMKSATPENLLSWWTLNPGATWRTPQGAGSSLEGLELYPVVLTRPL